jgi:hypothetical protein
MISGVQEFDDSTSLERRMLEWGAPRTRRSRTPTRTDLRASQNITVELVGVSTSDSGRREALEELRPLLFGTAWKVLDLLLEYAFDGLAKPNQKRWTIEAKQRHARSFDGALNGLTAATSIWERLCLVYDATVEARNALVHRRLEVDSNGSFVNAASSSTITVVEQEAMQGLALYCSEVALRQTCRTRDELTLGWYLNTLANLHGLQLLPSSVEGVPPIVVVNAEQHESRWVFDAQNAYEKAKSIHPGCTIFDLEIHLQGSTLPPVRGELESAAQNGVRSFDPAVVESWMMP